MKLSNYYLDVIDEHEHSKIGPHTPKSKSEMRKKSVYSTLYYGMNQTAEMRLDDVERNQISYNL
jgi:hypothetical protein